ncbi:hypothetical protein [Paenibacillus sp. NPDC057967]|uniref:hypothetical protein n=1 Tax=Paenibacillus sp. NPDC057967 TaxID=3346293 RepID=UPI0036D8FEA9
MSNLNNYLQKMADEVTAKNKRARGEEKRLTVVLSDYDHRRLKFISDKLGESAGAFARNIIVEALNDAEKVLKLDEYEPEPIGTDMFGDDVYRYSDYGNFINDATDFDVEVPELHTDLDFDWDEDK